LIGIRKGEELKTPRYASAAASRDDRLPYSRQSLYSNLNIASLTPFLPTAVIILDLVKGASKPLVKVVVSKRTEINYKKIGIDVRISYFLFLIVFYRFLIP
jgi:hypothetical protein